MWESRLRSVHAQSPRHFERCAALGREARLTGSLRSPEAASIGARSALRNRPPPPRGQNAVSDQPAGTDQRARKQRAARLTPAGFTRRAAASGLNAVARLPKASAQELRLSRSFG